MTAAVDQAAETILFVQDGEYIEAHIQIAIDPNTDASKFAWVLPMPSLPEVSVGSQPLFDALLAATTPNFSIGGGSCDDDANEGGAVKLDAGSDTGVPPDVHTEVVGAFEVSILDGGTVDSVMTWLGDNGYAQDPNAEPILADYLAQGYVLVAFKLVPNAAVAEIHPVVLRRLGDEPCVPLELTAIAARDDMAVRALFLGQERWAPTNYRHVVVDPLRLPWGNDSGYEAAVTMAIDEAPGGRGFITEYAGASSIVQGSGLFDPRWTPAPFATAEAVDVVDLLNAQGLADCGANGPCIIAHPLVVAMLRKYLPAPEGINENDFYACLSCYADQTEFADWDGPAFASELGLRVIAPASHASELLTSWPTLTRLFTTISPHEMTEDPTFHPAPDLPDVPMVASASRECLGCDDDSVVQLPDGRRVYCESYGLPSFGDELPWAERIEQIPANGAPIVEVDNTAAIDSVLAQWNDQHECMPSTESSGGGTAGTGAGEGAGSISPGGGSEDAGGDGGLDREARGCSCDQRSAGGWWWALALVAFGRGRQPGGATGSAARNASRSRWSGAKVSPSAR